MLKPQAQFILPNIGPWTIVAMQCGRVDSCQLCSVVSWSVRGGDWYTALCTGRHYKRLSTGGSHTHTHTAHTHAYTAHVLHTLHTHTQRCDSCREVGATVGCCTSSCSANFHFQCARDAKSVLYINSCSKIPFNATVHVISPESTRVGSVTLVLMVQIQRFYDFLKA